MPSICSTLLVTTAALLCVVQVGQGRPGSTLGEVEPHARNAEHLIEHWHLPELRRRPHITDGDAAKSAPGSGSFGSGGINSFAMIMVSEIGDETFIIAALMAMRHPKVVVFAGAIAALAAMTIISTALGFIVPNLISPGLVHHAATLLYTFFGLRLFYIAWQSHDPNEMKEEIHEVSGKLTGDKSHSNMRRFLTRFCTPVFLEAFILTFLAEWGDRSQIATITLAAHQNPYGVTVGAIIGHCICTGIACVGGELLAMRISQRSVAICGGSLFLLFALVNGLYKH